MRRTARFNDAEPIVSGDAMLFDGGELTQDRRKHSQKPYSQTLDSYAKMLPRGEFLLDAANYTDISASDTYQAEIIPLDELRQGRKESGHEVMFGQLLLRSNSVYELNMLVALKPYDTATEAVHEDSALRLVNQRLPRTDGPDGIPASLRPMGLCRFEDGATGLITEYDPAIHSYDNLFWNDDSAEHTEERVARSLARCGLAMARLHGEMLLHKDAQIKNWAADNHGIRYVDLEEMVYAPTTKAGELKVEDYAEGIEEELATFVSSLTGRTQNAQKRYDTQLDDYFWPVYDTTLGKSAHSIVRDEVLPLVRPIMDGDKVAF